MTKNERQQQAAQRRAEVAALKASGLTGRQIAARMGLSEQRISQMLQRAKQDKTTPQMPAARTVVLCNRRAIGQYTRIRRKR